ncbi:30S ribosomal protein S5 [Clostridium sp. 'deep sea']|uniref:30S ribosomal protein S5 n=1 Tax=Clostridium sp. 'deep sea' TaxID=2779445 RepID=UPI0018964360|nr:30S ribosomal protein S5 [Clostridium sp. 'deep sea']QOR34594.1 30S ribosomal protein S5 [Clostridium sp. 'deep sea']
MEKRQNKRRRNDKVKSDLLEKVIEIKPVSKTVKGGRVRSFSAIVAVGDGKGKVGVGLGKARGVPDAVRKAIDTARKNMVAIPLVGTTIPHQVLGVYGAGKVLLKPASEGTGVIAGSAARAILELVGVRDILTKSLGSPNKINIAYATMQGLKELQTAEQVSALRNKDIESLH